MEKDLYSERIEKISKIRCIPLYEDDILYYDGKIFHEQISSSKKSRTRLRQNVKVIIPKADFKLNYLTLWIKVLKIIFLD